jgi:PKD repeat protein
MPGISFRFHYFTGTFTVTLVLNNDIAHKISKAITIYSNTLSNSFTYSGVPCVGNTLSFIAIEPYETQYSWSFGDGPATSTAANPVHSYSATGVYTVTMTLNSTTTATHSITIYPAPSATVPGGTYHWSHKHIDYNTGVGPFDSSFTADTVLSLASINPTTLTFLSNTFYYTPASSTSAILVFNFSLYTNPVQNYYASGGLVYLPGTDSMYCNVWTHPGP